MNNVTVKNDISSKELLRSLGVVEYLRRKNDYLDDEEKRAFEIVMQMIKNQIEINSRFLIVSKTLKPKEDNNVISK